MIKRALLAAAMVATACVGVVTGAQPAAAACSEAGAWTQPAQYWADMGYLGQERVRLALGGIQNTLTIRGYMTSAELYDAATKMPYSERYTPATVRAVKDLENDPGSIVGTVDGKVGPTTARWLFQPYVLYNEAGYGIPRHLLHGVIGIEGDYDPGAVGCNDPHDRGILQYNSVAHPDVSDAEAFGDPVGMINRAAGELKARYDSYTGSYFTGLTNVERWNAAASGHNTPVGARDWAHCMAYNITLLSCTAAGVQAWDYFTDSAGADSGVEAYAAAYPY